MTCSAVIPSFFIILSIIGVAVPCDDDDFSPIEFVKETVSSHSIVMFSKTRCPCCINAKKVFRELNTEPYVIELDQIEDGSEIQGALGKVVSSRTVPQVFIKGKHIGGSLETIRSYKSGKLATLIGVDSSGKDEL